MPAPREIKRRLKSINNTKKITKAMELVSAAKMRKAVNRVVASRHYSHSSWDVLHNVSSRAKAVHYLLNPRPLRKVALLVITSNRGLCGGFNNNVLNVVLEKSAEYRAKGLEVEIITFGKKGREALAKLANGSDAKTKIAADFPKDDITRDVSHIIPLVRLVIDDYGDRKFDKVEIIYTDFISMLTQKARAKQILPMIDKTFLVADDSDSNDGEDDLVAESEEEESEYLFEPSMIELLNVLLPRILEVQIYQAVLESEASEHSARMMAMRNAADAAGDIISDLTLTFNQARQAGITREIAEISAGKIALE